MSDKKKRNLIIVLCILAVIIAVVAIAFAPFGRKATGDSDSPNITDVSDVTETTQITTAESTTISETTETTADSTETTFVVPPSTDPVINPNKNYTLFIDKTVFDASENDDGVTTLTAKDNGAVKMTITPVREMGYRECCRATEKNHKKLNGSAALEIANTNTAYRSQTGDNDSDVITTVYCVDEDKGGCIIIECRTPVNATKYMETIEIMLSMFKVL